jgi:hypothetical protein
LILKSVLDETAGEVRPDPAEFSLEARKQRQDDDLMLINAINNNPECLFPRLKNPNLLSDGGVQQDYKTHIEISCRNIRQTASYISVLSIIPLGRLSY